MPVLPNIPDINSFIPIFSEIGNLSPEQQNNLLDYYNSVNKLANDNLNIEFNNNDEYHAAVVMSFIFNKAEKNIRIFAGDFNGKVCNKSIYLKALEQSFNANDSKKLEVVFCNKPQESEGFKLIKKLKVQHPKNVEIRVLTDQYKTALTKNATNLAHFTIGDDKMYRYEADTSNYKSFCNFDDGTTTKLLNNNFDFLKVNSVEI